MGHMRMMYANFTATFLGLLGMSGDLNSEKCVGLARPLTLGIPKQTISNSWAGAIRNLKQLYYMRKAYCPPRICILWKLSLHSRNPYMTSIWPKFPCPFFQRISTLWSLNPTPYITPPKSLLSPKQPKFLHPKP